MYLCPPTRNAAPKISPAFQGCGWKFHHVSEDGRELTKENFGTKTRTLPPCEALNARPML